MNVLMNMICYRVFDEYIEIVTYDSCEKYEILMKYIFFINLLIFSMDIPRPRYKRHPETILLLPHLVKGAYTILSHMVKGSYNTRSRVTAHG